MTKITRAVAALILLLCISAPALGGQDDKAPNDASPNAEVDAEIRAFGESFFTDAHIAECVAALDSLRQLGRRQVYQSDFAVLELGAPAVETSSGILMAYTMVSRSDAIVHHFSVSRAPYLATAFGRNLVGLACLRLAFPAPEAILVSPRQVFHAEWPLTPVEHAALVSRELPPRPERMSTLVAQALLLTAGTTLRHFEVDYDAVRRFKRGSSDRVLQPPAPREGQR